jgi:hypothetical protein
MQNPETSVPGFTKIMPGYSLRFDLPSHCCISIFTQSGAVLADDMPKMPNSNVIVTRDGQVVDAKYGDVWVDVTGRNWKA